ncbi:MAG: gamma carbonic anhydrase family protein [Chloroflexi bacterium]|nr:gamma carbonic anhydrase family protein [Chloroflexota bacterium]
MAVFSFKGHSPNIHPSVYVAEGVQIIGRVTIGEDAGIWFNSVIRADSDSITIGPRTNIQDKSMVHCDFGEPTRIGADVTLGHGATVHAATIEDAVLVGINSVVLNRAVVGAGSIIAAGAVVLEGQIIPPRSLVVGIPGKVVRRLTDEEVSHIREMADSYVQRQQEYRASARRLVNPAAG